MILSFEMYKQDNLKELFLYSNNSLKDVLLERVRQYSKWGEQNHDPSVWLAILMEEVGEFSEAFLELRVSDIDEEYERWEHMREEAVQVAAVALQIVECLDRKYEYDLRDK